MRNEQPINKFNYTMENIEGEEVSSDENDIFQCGKCKSEFCSFSLFKAHKLLKCKRNITNQSKFMMKDAEMSSVNYDTESTTKAIVENLRNENEECTNTIISTDDILSPIVKKAYYPNNSVQVISVNGIIHLSAPMDDSEIVASVSNLFSRTNNTEQAELSEDEIMAPIKSDMLELSSEHMETILPIVKTEDIPQEDSLNYNHALFHGSLAKSDTKTETFKTKVKHKCSYCGSEFVKSFDLQQHIRSHTGEKPFQCMVCGRSFAQKSNVKKHMETHKVWPTESLTNTLPKEPIKKVFLNDNEEIMFDSSFVCYFCDMSFSSYIKLRSHMKIHSDKKVYKCVQLNCEQTFDDMDTFMDHVRQHGKDTIYRCHTCEASFESLQSLGMHHAEHSFYPNSKKKAGESYFRCTKCLNKYSSAEALEYHLLNTNHNFPCHHCSKVYSAERLLRRHLRIHGKPTFTSCSTCKKEYKNIYQLKLHLLTHTGEKAFKCQMCNAAFYRKDGMKRHMLIHSDKKLKCPFRVRLGCMVEFRRTDKLRGHILSHLKTIKKLCKTKNKNYSISVSIDSKDDNTKQDEYVMLGNPEEMDQHFVPERENIEIIENCNTDDKNNDEVALFEEHPLYEQQIQLIDGQKLSDDTPSDFAYESGGKKYEIVQIPFDPTWQSRSLDEGSVVIHDDALGHASAIFCENGETFVSSEITDLSLFVTPHVEECASIELASKDVSWNESS